MLSEHLGSSDKGYEAYVAQKMAPQHRMNDVPHIGPVKHQVPVVRSSAPRNHGGTKYGDIVPGDILEDIIQFLHVVFRYCDYEKIGDSCVPAQLRLLFYKGQAPVPGDAGVVHFDRERPGHAMLNTTRLSMLLVGALRQIGARVESLEARALPA